MFELPIVIVKAEIRFREIESGGSSTWEVYNYILFSDGSVYQPTICFKDSQSAAMDAVEEIYNYPACD